MKEAIIFAIVVLFVIVIALQQKTQTLTFNTPEIVYAQDQPSDERTDVETTVDGHQVSFSVPKGKKAQCISCKGGGSAAVTKKYNQILQVDPNATIGQDDASLYRVANTKEAYPLPTGPGEKAYKYTSNQPENRKVSRNDQQGAVPEESQTSYQFRDYAGENFDQQQMGIGLRDPNKVPDLTIISPTGEESRITQKYNFRDLQAKYSWEDFHKGEGQTAFAPGTMPTFGLWTSFDNVPNYLNCETYSMKPRWTNSCWKPELALYGRYGG